MLTRSLGDDRSLRLFEESDAEELYALVDANRDHLARYMEWPREQTLARTLEWIRSGRAQLGKNQGCQLAVMDDGRIVGTIGYHRIDWPNRATSLGYWLARHAQGRGSMTAAVGVTVDHAFTTWDLHRLEIQAAVDNHRSRAIPERLGFSRDGVRRHAERIGGRWVDLVLYAVLAPEWRARGGERP